MERRDFLKAVAAGTALGSLSVGSMPSGVGAESAQGNVTGPIPFETWTQLRRPNGVNPLIQTTGSDFDTDAAAAAHHIVDGDTVHYMWAGSDTSTSPHTWKIARSSAPTTDPLNLTRSSANPIVEPGASGTWDEAAVEYPSPYYNPARDAYEMYYLGNDSNSVHRIGHAKRGSDWDTWSKNSANPVMEPSGSGYRSQEVGWQDVCVVDDTIHIVYTADDGSTNGMTLAHATAPTTDPTNISQDPNNPILTAGGLSWTASELREPGVWHAPDGYIHVFYCGKDTDWYGAHMRVDESLADWASGDLEQNPDNPLWSAAPSGWESPDFLTPVIREIESTYYMVYAAGTSTPYQTGVMTMDALTERDQFQYTTGASWAPSSSTYMDSESASGQLGLGSFYDFEQDRLSGVTNVTGALSLAIGANAKNNYFAAKSDSGSGLINSNHAWHRFETPNYPYTATSEVAGWVKTTNDGSASNAGGGFVAIDESNGAYVRAVINPGSTSGPELFDDANNALGTGSWDASWDTYYWIEFIPDVANGSYTIEAYDAPGGTKLGSASGSYSGLSDYALGMISYKENAAYFDDPVVKIPGQRGTWRGGLREFSSPIDPSSVETSSETLVGSASTARARLHSDPDNDGTWEETSDWATIDGTGESVTGLTTETERVELEVELEASDTANWPAVDALDFAAELVSSTTASSTLDSATPVDPFDSQPSTVDLYSYDSVSSVLNRYQPYVDLSKVDEQPSEMRAWAFDHESRDTRVAAYWLIWDGDSQDREPVFVEYDPDTADVVRVHYDAYDYLLESNETPPVHNDTHPLFTVSKDWHAIAPTTTVGEQLPLSDMAATYPDMQADWQASSRATLDPWTAADRGHMWGETFGFSTDAAVSGAFYDLQQAGLDVPNPSRET